MTRRSTARCSLAIECKKEELERAGGKLSASKGSIATLTDESKTLGGNIKALDKMVAEATDNPKVEKSDFKTLLASDSTLKEILAFPNVA